MWGSIEEQVGLYGAKRLLEAMDLSFRERGRRMEWCSKEETERVAEERPITLNSVMRLEEAIQRERERERNRRWESFQEGR